MRILANENVPGPVVTGVRDAGHDVLWVKESMAGATDHEVLTRAEQEGRLLVTFDKDFGELAVRTGLPASSGVVLLRLRGDSPEADNARAIAALTSRDD
jgi:predicted nuclease of predicted toxin-antitoxin system